MAKKKKKKQARYWGFTDADVQRFLKAREANKVTALLIVDNESILTSLRKEYRRILRQTEKAEKDFQTFQQKDFTAWNEWINSQFGPLLTEIRDCFEQSQRLNEIFAKVDELMFLHEVPSEQAYKIYKAQQEGTWDEVSKYFKIKDPYDIDDNPEDIDPSFPDPTDDLSDEDLMKAFAEQLGRMYEKETGRKPPGYEQVMNSLGGKKKPQAAPAPRQPPPPPDRSIKNIYRTIVLRLHPDRNKEFTPYQQGLWNEAQVAYRNQDLSALELILARIDSNNDDLASINRVSLMHSLIEKVQRDLKKLQMHLNDAKKSPAWKFTQTKNLQPLHAKAKREMEYQLRNVKLDYLELKEEFEEMERECETWWQKITRPRPAKKKKQNKKPKTVESLDGELPF